VLRLHHREVRTQQPGQRIGQHGHAILATLAIAHRDLPRGEIDILDPQAHAFHQAHAGAVEQAQHQARGAIQPRQHRPHLGRREHRRQARRLLRPLDAVQPRQGHFQHFAVEKQDRRKRQVLRRRRHVAIHRETGQKGLDLRRAHLLRVPLVIEQNKAFNPVRIGFLGTDAVSLAPDAVTNAVKQLRRISRSGRGGNWWITFRSAHCSQ
jgi:hypothetical protein